MKFRHEYKIPIHYGDYLILRSRLRSLLSLDSHAEKGGEYHIRSLYFDNLYDKALREKVDGVDKREKFRIRYYNGDPSCIHLEKKSKIHNLCSKESTPLTKKEAIQILEGRIGWMANHPGVLSELFTKMRCQGLQPKTIVDYNREPYVYPPGNVRITLDKDIHTGLYSTDFFASSLPAIPAGEPIILLEVKYDEFLPQAVAGLLRLESRTVTAFSKYAACRIYG